MQYVNPCVLQLMMSVNQVHVKMMVSVWIERIASLVTVTGQDLLVTSVKQVKQVKQVSQFQSINVHTVQLS